MSYGMCIISCSKICTKSHSPQNLKQSTRVNFSQASLTFIFFPFYSRPLCTKIICTSCMSFAKTKKTFRKDGIKKIENNKNEKIYKNYKKSLKNQGGVKTAAGSDLSLVSGDYHEDGELAVMAMASISLKIRHVFGDTFLTENCIEHFLQQYYSSVFPPCLPSLLELGPSMYIH